MQRFIKGKQCKYDFYGGSNATDNPIKLTRDGNTCDALLFPGLDGLETFIKLGNMGLLMGKALEIFKMNNYK